MGPDAKKRKNLKKKLKQKQKKAVSAISVTVSESTDDFSVLNTNDTRGTDVSSTVDRQQEPNEGKIANVSQLLGPQGENEHEPKQELPSFPCQTPNGQLVSDIAPLGITVEDRETIEATEENQAIYDRAQFPPSDLKDDSNFKTACTNSSGLQIGATNIPANLTRDSNGDAQEVTASFAATGTMNPTKGVVSGNLESLKDTEFDERSEVLPVSPSSETTEHRDYQSHSYLSHQINEIKIKTANDQSNISSHFDSSEIQPPRTGHLASETERIDATIAYPKSSPLEADNLDNRSNAVMPTETVSDLFGNLPENEELPWEVDNLDPANSSTIISPLHDHEDNSEAVSTFNVASESMPKIDEAIVAKESSANNKEDSYRYDAQESYLSEPSDEQEPQQSVEAFSTSPVEDVPYSARVDQASDLFGNFDDDGTLPWEGKTVEGSGIAGQSNIKPLEEDIQSFKVSDETGSLAWNDKMKNRDESNPFLSREEPKKFSFLEEDDDILDDDDSYLESADEDLQEDEQVEQRPPFQSTASYIPVAEPEPIVAPFQISINPYAPNPSTPSRQNSNIGTSKSSDPYGTVSNITLGAHGSIKPRFVNNTSGNSSQSNIGQVDELHKKLDEAKHKTDAYDFPLELVKPGKLEHAKPVNLRTSSQVAGSKTSFPPNVNISKPTQVPVKPFYADLPIPAINTSRAAPVRITSNYSSENSLPAAQRNIPATSEYNSLPQNTSVNMASYQNPYAPNVTAVGNSNSFPITADKINPPNLGSKTQLSAPPGHLKTSYSGSLSISPSNPYSQLGQKTSPDDNVRKTSSYMPSIQQNRGRTFSNVSANSSGSFAATVKVPLTPSHSQGFPNLHDGVQAPTQSHSRYTKAPLENINTSSTTKTAPLILSPTSTGRRTHARSNSSVYAPGNHLHSSKYAPTVQPQFQQHGFPSESSPPLSQGVSLPPSTFKRQAATSRNPQISAFDHQSLVQNNTSLEKRQFPIFHWGRSSKIVFAVPSAQGYIGNGVSRVNEIKICPYDSFLRTENYLKEFPGPLVRGKSKPKEVEKWIDLCLNSFETQGMKEYSVLCKLLKLKLQPQVSFKNIGDVLYDSAGLIPYLSQPFMPNKNAFNAHKLEDPSLMRVLALLQTGSSEQALQLSLQQQDYAMSLLLGSILGKEKWSSVIEQYVKEEFHNRVDKDNSMANLLAIIFQVFVGDAVKVMDNLRADPLKLQWALSNWSIILSSILNNCENSSKDGMLPPYIIDFLVRFGTFLFESDCKIAGTIAFIIADVPLSDSRVVPTSCVTFMGLGSINSFEGCILSELYEFCYKSKEPSFVRFPCLLSLKTSHAAALYEYGQPSLAGRYLDYIHTEIKSMPKKPENISMILRYIEIINSQFSSSAAGWLGKPTLSSVWGQLDKSFNKFIGGDTDVDEPSDKGPEEKVFESFTPSSKASSRNPSMVDLSQAPYFTPSVTRDTSSKLAAQQRTQPISLPSGTPYQPMGAESQYTMPSSRKNHFASQQTERLSRVASNVSLVSHGTSAPPKMDIHAGYQATVKVDPAKALIPPIVQHSATKRDSSGEKHEIQTTQQHHISNYGLVSGDSDMHMEEDMNIRPSVVDSAVDAKSQILSTYTPSLYENSSKMEQPSMHIMNSYYAPVRHSNHGQFQPTCGDNVPVSAASQSSTLHGSEKPTEDTTVIDDVVQEIADEIEEELQQIHVPKNDQQKATRSPTVENLEFEPLGSPVLNSFENVSVHKEDEQIAKEFSLETSSGLGYSKNVEIQAPLPSRPSMPERKIQSTSSVEIMSNPYNPASSSRIAAGGRRKNSYNPYAPSNPSAIPTNISAENEVHANDIPLHGLSPRGADSENNYDLNMYSYGGYKLSEEGTVDNEQDHSSSTVEDVDKNFSGKVDIDYVPERNSVDPHFAPIVENESDEEKDRILLGTNGPVIRPIENRKFAPFIPSPSGGGPYYDDVVDDSDEEQEQGHDSSPTSDTEINNVKQGSKRGELEGKHSVEKEERDDDDYDDDDDDDDDVKRKKQLEEESDNRKKPQGSGGWLGWFKKDPNEKKPIKAKLGNKNNFYYDENLKRWVNKDATAEELEVVKTPPPPPPIVKRKISSTPEVKPRQGSIIGGPALRTAHAVMPTNPLTGKPLDPVKDFGDSNSKHPEKDSSSPVSLPHTNINLAGTKANGLDDLMALTGESGLPQSARRKKKSGRRYVNVMDEL